MNYRGSYSTRDIPGSLVARWLNSGEWERLKQLPPTERHIGESVRRFILDRIDQLRRRISLGAANKRIREGTNYLVVLQGVVSGIGGSA
jgi:hypothetical protein